jgi:hypothetical protein
MIIDNYCGTRLGLADNFKHMLNKHIRIQPRAKTSG